MNFIDNFDTCVPIFLKAFSNFNSNIAVVAGTSLVVRRDIGSVKDKVVILSGGGSGHEPAHAGFVGKGMLSAAVCGGVFTSPPANAILEGICQIGKTSKNGVLLIVKNYTGDRINFSIAAERAKKLKIQVEMVVVGDDTAVEEGSNICGRRGLAGTVLIHKLSGAMAERAYKLKDIKEFLDKILKPGNMGTIGISFTGARPFKLSTSSEIGDGVYELGLGIHGEAGIKKVQYKNVDLLIKEMTKYLTSSRTGGVSLIKGDKIVILVNNLGSCSSLELFTVAYSFIDYLEKKFNVVISLGYCGNYVTALQMYGISFTILKVLDDRILEFLNDTCEVTGWNNFVYKVSDKMTSDNVRKPILGTEKNIFAHDSSHSKKEIVSENDFKQLVKIINSVCDTLVKNEEYLNNLDKEIGDSDCGTTFKKGGLAVKNFFDQWNNDKSNKYMSLVLSNLSFVLENHMGGSSGGLLSLFFETLSNKYRDSPEVEWCELFLQSTYTVSDVGGAVEGDRTMLDVLFPVLKMWKSLEKRDITSALPKLVDVAKTSSRSTMKMKAKAGRASYVKNSAMFEKYPDPGAEAISIIIEAISKVFP